jgi:hypothetical protein
MTVVTRDFHEAHARLRERAELLADAAKVLPAVSPTERESLRDDIVEFLREQVVPHTVLDERVLFPEVSRRLGDPLATATMNYDHVAIRDWIDDVAAADLDDTARLQQLLYGLHALIQVHIWKEERLYLTLLESPSWPAG